jgi:hypothetical protein
MTAPGAQSLGFRQQNIRPTPFDGSFCRHSWTIAR